MKCQSHGSKILELCKLVVSTFFVWFILVVCNHVCERLISADFSFFAWIPEFVREVIKPCYYWMMGTPRANEYNIMA